MNGFSAVQSKINEIGTSFSNLWTDATTFMSGIFVSQEGSYSHNLMDVEQATLRAKWEEKFGIFDGVDFSVASASIAPLEIPFLMGTVVSFAWFVPYAETFKGMMRVLLYLTMLAYVVRNVQDLYS